MGNELSGHVEEYLTLLEHGFRGLEIPRLVFSRNGKQQAQVLIVNVPAASWDFFIMLYGFL